MAERFKVLFLSSEAVPFAKTGGLADVAGSLPGALQRQGADVRMVLPLYAMVREGSLEVSALIDTLTVPLGGEGIEAEVLEAHTEDGVPVYLVEQNDFYDRPNLYGNGVSDYPDNFERFAFFSHAALRVAEALQFKPDVIHCHDWQTGLVPALLREPYAHSPYVGGAATVFTIHNVGYQGLFSSDKLPLTGLSRDTFFHLGGLEFWGNISLLKAGIVYSEAVTTVSPTYAKEIQTPEYGRGMDGILLTRRDALYGILNGVDYQVWDPSQDIHLLENYSPTNMAGKRACKRSMLREMNLDDSLEARPVLGMITRLDTQKGLDLLLEILGDVLALEVGLVLLGSGSESIQSAIQKVADTHRKRIGLKIGFDDSLAHRIMAGADIFLVPSRYEPCGLTQMYALRYGTIPVVRATGGLQDTVVAFNPQTGEGNGFKFIPYEAKAFLRAIKQSVDLFEDANTWKKVMANGMNADFSWDRSAQKYMEIYQSLAGAA